MRRVIRSRKNNKSKLENTHVLSIRCIILHGFELMQRIHHIKNGFQSLNNSLPVLRSMKCLSDQKVKSSFFCPGNALTWNILLLIVFQHM